MRALAAALLVAGCAPLAAGAQAAVGLTVWQPDIRGAVFDEERLDLRDDLALRSGSDLVFDVALRRGRLEALAEHARLRATGQGMVDRDLQLGGLTLIPAESELRSRADVDDSVLTLRWRFGGAALAVSPGISARYLDAEVALRESDVGGQRREVESLSELFPMAHLAAEARWGAVALQARGNYVEYDGDRVYDVTADAVLRPAAVAPLVLGIGWQLRDYRVSREGDEDADVRLDGLRLRLGLRW